MEADFLGIYSEIGHRTVRMGEDLPGCRRIVIEVDRMDETQLIVVYIHSNCGSEVKSDVHPNYDMTKNSVLKYPRTSYSKRMRGVTR